MKTLHDYFLRLRTSLVAAIILVMASLLSSPGMVEAATVGALTDQPSSLEISQVSNHKFTFTLANDWSDGSTVTLTFATGFTVPALFASDADVTHDGTDSVVGSDCTGSTEVTMGVAGNVVTFSMCPGNGGDFGTGTVVSIEIGTNASVGGFGTQRITNPSTEGTYYIALDGTSDNQGSIPLPIGLQDGSGVSVTVTGGADEDDDSGGGGGNPPPPPPPPDPGPDPEPEPEPEPQPEPEPEPEPNPNPNPEPTPDPNPTPTPTPVPTPTPTPAPEPTPPTTPEPEPTPETPRVTVEVFATPEIVLPQTNGGVLVIPGTTSTVVVDVGDTDVPPRSVMIVIGDDEYILSPNGDGTFSGSIPAPAAADAFSVIVILDNGERLTESVGIEVAKSGSIYEVVNGSRVPVGNAVVTVYAYESGREVAWTAPANGLSNPVLTPTGTFSWYVPNGTYVVYVTKDGYQESRTVVTVRNNILAPTLEIEREPTVVPGTDPQPGVPPIVTNIENILDLPIVEAGARVSESAVVALAIGSIALMALSFNLLPYLQYIFTSPFIFFARRKRRAYGVVYNAITKVPLELVTLRLYNSTTNRLIKSIVTGPEGHYVLAVSPGKYRLQAFKTGFVFPSSYLAGEQVDGKYVDIYTGQEIEITEKDALIAANIPLDPSDKSAFHEPRSLAIRRLLRTVQMVMAPIGLLLSIAVYVIVPSTFAAIMIGVQAVVMLLALRLAKAKRPKGWGIVYDAASHAPVGNTVIRLYEPKYNKLVESTLTDSLGRYSFLLGANEYYVSYSKPGYTEQIVRPIDYTRKSEPTPLAVNVGLQRGPEEPHAPTP